MLQERRQYQRLTPTLPQLVFMDESKYSLLFDIGEGGLAVEGFAAKSPSKTLSLEFDLPEGNGSIQARGEIIWTGEFGHRTGFRFLDLEEASRQQLRDWIAAASESRLSAIEGQLAQQLFGSVSSQPVERPLPRTVREEKPPALPAVAHRLPPEPEYRFENPRETSFASLDQEHRPTHVLGILITAVLASLAFLVGYYWRASHPHRPTSPSVAVAPLRMHPEPPPSAPIVNPAKVGQLSIAPSLPLDVPGVVLQVGAMSQEINADALSENLHKNNFAAFVFKRGNDRFYRVVVGPFPDEGAALETKRQLQAQGFGPILRPWSPD